MEKWQDDLVSTGGALHGLIDGTPSTAQQRQPASPPGGRGWPHPMEKARWLSHSRHGFEIVTET